MICSTQSRCAPGHGVGAISNSGKGSPKQNEGSLREGNGEKRKPPAERTSGAKAQKHNWVKGRLSLAEEGSEIISTDDRTPSCMPTKVPLAAAGTVTGSQQRQGGQLGGCCSGGTGDTA